MVLEKGVVEAFPQFLNRQRLELVRAKTTVLQINVGLVCNLTCRHCHLEAGQTRRELMNMEVARAVIDFTRLHFFRAIDITGGAPEMNPILPQLLQSLSPLTTELILRSNLTPMAEGNYDDILDLCTDRRVTIVCSFPSLHKEQFESQRGKDVFAKVIEALRKLNSKGYGLPDTGLRLDLVSNPTGAFLAASQAQVEKKFRLELKKNFGITFTNLYVFGNVPLGRFKQWLVQTGNYEGYMQKLFSSFNPCALSGLMCRSLISVSWDGYLYDCDFNQAANIPLGGRKTHISEIEIVPAEGSPISAGEHCYACTAGAGFT
ncbi:MAG: arsenosugar biosynthesis radical SAM (seleno)protein ArsS [Syntrophobacteraceae bacterium]|jgi:radical SAM/Cys-rich protein